MRGSGWKEKRACPMLGKDLPEVKKLLAKADGNELSRGLAADGKIELELADRRKLDEYLYALRDVEKRLTMSERESCRQAGS